MKNYKKLKNEIINFFKNILSGILFISGIIFLLIYITFIVCILLIGVICDVISILYFSVIIPVFFVYNRNLYSKYSPLKESYIEMFNEMFTLDKNSKLTTIKLFYVFKEILEENEE